MAPSAQLHRSINKWGARVIPGLLVGITGYVTWVVVALLAVSSLLRPDHDNPQRTGAGIAIIVLFFALLVITFVYYTRVLQVVLANSGCVQRPPDSFGDPSSHNANEQSNTAQFESSESYLQTDGTSPSQMTGYLDRTAVLTGRIPAPAGLEQYYLADVYECDTDGLPRWCSRCKGWKPDRSHHCSEVGKCVYKMDHFCPWAGGLVSETNFKFFIQFCIFGCIFCGFILIVSAYFLAHIERLSNLKRVNFIVTIALSALFLLFASGMAMNSVNFAFLNTTTVDNLSRRTRVYSLAVRLTDHDLANPTLGSRFSTITYPLGISNRDSLDNSAPPQDLQSQKRRTFAILTSPPGGNPYDLRTMMQNFRTVMGDRWYEWFSPFGYSPCYTRRVAQQALIAELNMESSGSLGDVSLYEFGPLLQRMKRDAGLEQSSVDVSYDTEKTER